MDAALTEIRQALKIRPKAPNYWNWLGIFLKTTAEYKLGRGIIDAALIEQSIDACRRSLQLRPNNPNAYNSIGPACRMKAFAAMLEGVDQRPPLREAVSALEEANRLNPDYPDPYQNLALIYQDLTFYELNYGLDPRDSARKAISRCEQAILHAPQNSYLAVVRSGVLFALAIFDLNTGGDGQAIRQFLTAARAAVEANPRRSHAHMQLSQASQLLARWQMRRGEDPVAAIRGAKASGERTVALDAGNPYGYHSLAGAWLAEAEWTVRHGKGPGRSLAEAERFARRCVRMILARPDPIRKRRSRKPARRRPFSRRRCASTRTSAWNWPLPWRRPSRFSNRPLRPTQNRPSREMRLRNSQVARIRHRPAASWPS